VSEQPNTPNYIELAADLVSAFVSKNSVPAAELPALIGSVHQALTQVASGSTQQPTEEPKKAPTVSVKKSVQPDYIVCLEDGKRFKPGFPRWIGFRLTF
jgi:predicted transcriptional regulator